MNETILKDFIKEVINEDMFVKRDRERGYPRGSYFGSDEPKKEKGWFQSFLDFFKNDKSSATDVAQRLIDDFEEKTLIEMPDSLKERMIDFAEQKYPIAIKKTKGDQKRASRLLSKVMGEKFYRELRRLRAEYSDDRDSDWY